MRKNAKKSQAPKANWIGTFNDLVTLLLTFFVLLLSLSKLDVAKEKEISYSFSNTSGFMEGGGIIEIDVFSPFVAKCVLPNPFAKYRLEKRAMIERINEGGQLQGEDIIEGLMYARAKKTGISAVLPGTMLFRTGMAEIEDKNNPALKTLCSILQETDCRIRVEGHTDDVPIRSTRFASNWELSAARAVSVLKYIISEGGISRQRLSVAAYADSRPLFRNTNAHNRKMNRRVEVVLTFDNKEQQDG